MDSLIPFADSMYDILMSGNEVRWQSNICCSAHIIIFAQPPVPPAPEEPPDPGGDPEPLDPLVRLLKKPKDPG